MRLREKHKKFRLFVKIHGLLRTRECCRATISLAQTARTSSKHIAHEKIVMPKASIRKFQKALLRYYRRRTSTEDRYAVDKKSERVDKEVEKQNARWTEGRRGEGGRESLEGIERK